MFCVFVCAFGILILPCYILRGQSVSTSIPTLTNDTIYIEYISKILYWVTFTPTFYNTKRSKFV